MRQWRTWPRVSTKHLLLSMWNGRKAGWMERALHPHPCHGWQLSGADFGPPCGLSLFCFDFSPLSFAHLPFMDGFIPFLIFFEIHFFSCLSLYSCYYFLLRSLPLPFIWLILQGSAFHMEIFWPITTPAIWFHSTLCFSFLTLIIITVT